MQIKKFTADSFAAAMKRVKAEWGDNALVLSTRSISSGGKFLRGKMKPEVEITAAMDYPGENGENSTTAETEPLAQREAHIGEEGANLKDLVYTLLSQTDRARSMGLKKRQLKLYKKLVDRGVNEKLAAKMFEKINSNKNAAESESLKSDKKELADLMKRVLVCTGAIEPGKTRPKVVALVGPTGVGKTTTIAKLAAHYALEKRKKVALISLDNYRIGALDQLKLYGEIMQVPVETASEASEFRALLRKHSDKDFIFVDTMGKCHKDHSYARRLNEIVNTSGPVEIHLVLSVNLQEKMFEEAFRQFSPLNIDRVLFTKLDEGMGYGSMFNFSLRTKLPFSYFTTGQRVPEDIELAAEDKVIRLIFN